ASSSSPAVPTIIPLSARLNFVAVDLRGSNADEEIKSATLFDIFLSHFAGDVASNVSTAVCCPGEQGRKARR
ncbi:MAG: hypothetical protein ACM34G_08595, partial [Acidobacteriota bacterium]